jgi:hypothetical protein
MECLDFRRAAGADPRHLGAEAVAHRDACPRCAEFLRQMLELDEKILTALRVPVPDLPFAREVPRVVRFPTIERRRWMALAASIVGGVLIGSLLWVSEPRTSLAQDVVKHMAHEPEAMAVTSVEADRGRVVAVLARDEIRLRPDAGMVSYAQSCPFRGETVPHLVVQTDSGPVTVMVLRHEKVKAPMKFSEGGYSGTIVPAGPGSIAVIGGSGTNLQQVADRVVSAVEWK